MTKTQLTEKLKERERELLKGYADACRCVNEYGRAVTLNTAYQRRHKCKKDAAVAHALAELLERWPYRMIDLSEATMRALYMVTEPVKRGAERGADE
jgi:hypothetical protein